MASQVGTHRSQLGAVHEAVLRHLRNLVPLNRSVSNRRVPAPKGPQIGKFQDRPPGLKISISIENFNPDPQQTPIFCGEF